MKHSSFHLVSASIALVLAACSSGDSAPISGADSGDLPSLLPQAPPCGASSGSTRWFAISKLHLGPTDRSGRRSRDAWKHYGYDLDGRITTDDDSQANRDTCKRRADAGPKALSDGEQGRDNNFGQHVAVTVTSFNALFEETANDILADGETTLLLKLENVGPDCNASVPGTLYVAGNLGRKATFTETDVWPITSGSESQFPTGYMVDGTWVSGGLGTGTASLPIPGITNGAALPLSSAVISFDVRTGEGGVIAGAVKVTDLTSAVGSRIATFGMCPGTSNYDAVMQSIAASADLVASAPSLQDPSRECDAISIGIGFTARPTGATSTLVSPPAPVPPSCE